MRPVLSALLAVLAVCLRPALAHGSGGIVSALSAACAEGVRQAVHQELMMLSHHVNASELVENIGAAPVWPCRPPGEQACPPGWTRHERSCYLIPPQTTNWYRAHHACAVLHPGAKLASVHPDSGPFVESMVASSGAEKAVWVGLFGSGKAAGEWVWSDGSAFDYAHWDRNQPDGGDPSCVHLGWPGFTNNLWHDNSCAVVINVLCQIELR